MCDDCRNGANPDAPPRDWRVDSIEGLPGFYAYRVTGENLNRLPGHADRTFSWRVPNLDDPRYDATDATIDAAALANMERTAAHVREPNRPFETRAELAAMRRAA